MTTITYNKNIMYVYLIIFIIYKKYKNDKYYKM